MNLFRTSYIKKQQQQQYQFLQLHSSCNGYTEEIELFLHYTIQWCWNAATKSDSMNNVVQILHAWF